jgi:AAA+ ATPase superfamily predicted ATPase
MQKRKFIGRENELALLNEAYQEKKSSITVLYGRRRVGKSYLLREFVKNKPCLSFEGIEDAPTLIQLEQFLKFLQNQVNEPLLKDVIWRRWIQALDYITNYTAKSAKKYIIILDEFQWMSCMQSRLTALIKTYWDQYWLHNNKVMLVLCGSISSFMVEKVIHSKALYGRIRSEICVQPLSLSEIYELLDKNRGEMEILKYYLIFGGIPKYYEDVKLNQSFDQNIERICFRQGSSMEGEFQKVFYSQFREARIYQQIVELLIPRPLTFSEITKKLKLPPSGGSRSYLKNLELAHFIMAFHSYNEPNSAQNIKFKLTDEYIVFYKKFIDPNLKLIKSGFDDNFFKNRILPTWKPWLGYAFETFGLKNAVLLAKKMGFANLVESFGPYFKRKDKGFQFDLVYRRTDKVITVCEIKFYDKPVELEVIHEFQSKLQNAEWPSGYTIERALIAPLGANKTVIASKYFHHIIDLKKLF